MNKLNLHSAGWFKAKEKAARVSPVVALGASSSLVAAVYFVARSGGGSARVVLSRAVCGSPSAECLCPAGQRGLVCYHIAAAVALHSAFVAAGCRPALVPLGNADVVVDALIEEAMRVPNNYVGAHAPTDWIDEAEQILRDEDEFDFAEERWERVFALEPESVRAVSKVRNVARWLDSVDNSDDLEIGDICEMSRQLYGVLNAEQI